MSEREADGDIVAEVAHEAFLRAWPRLGQWLREEREFLVFKGEAERAERRWRQMGQADQALLSGLDLARAEEWLPKRPEDLSAEVTAYVQRGIAYDRAAKERQLKFQRRVTLGAITAALLMAVIGGFASWQWKDAASERDRAMAAEKRVAAERDRAESERDRATAAEKRVAAERDRADTKLAEAQTTQSRFLADLARQRRTTPARLSCLLLRGFPTTQPGLPDPMSPKQRLARVAVLRSWW